METFSKAGYYGLIGLSQPMRDEGLGSYLCRELTEFEKECIVENELAHGSKDQLIEEAAEFFGDRKIFYRDEDGIVQGAFFYDFFELPDEGRIDPAAISQTN
jgi:hypothetical protein